MTDPLFRGHVSSSQWFLDEIHDMLGMRLEPKKRKLTSGENVALGVNVNVSEASSGRRVSFKPTPERTGAILHTMEQAKKADYMSPRTAAEILGRLNFLLCISAYHSCGRAATQPLVSRCCGLGRRRQ